MISSAMAIGIGHRTKNRHTRNLAPALSKPSSSAIFCWEKTQPANTIRPL